MGLLLVVYCFGLCGIVVLCFIKVAVSCGDLFCFRRLRFAGVLCCLVLVLLVRVLVLLREVDVGCVCGRMGVAV